MRVAIAPAIGPVWVGWLTDEYGWPWIVYQFAVGYFRYLDVDDGSVRSPSPTAKIGSENWPVLMSWVDLDVDGPHGDADASVRSAVMRLGWLHDMLERLVGDAGADLIEASSRFRNLPF